MTPFLTLYTPTYRRPQALAQCLESVRVQTAVAAVEQIVIPDHVGVSVGGMFERVPLYADAVHGNYVAFLCDDDVLAGPHVVAQVKDVAEAHGQPPLIIVQTMKGGFLWPDVPAWPPRLGHIDLNCLIVRADIWRQHVQAYGDRYEGDYDFARSLENAGVTAVVVPLLFSTGAVSRGVPEAVCA